MPLAEIFVAEPSTVETIDATTVPTSDLGAIDVKRLDIVKLGQLRSLLSGEPFAAVLPEFPAVREVSDDGPWVYQISDPLVESRASMDDSTCETTAARWANTDEMQMDGFDVAAAHVLLQELTALAAEASGSDRKVYLWNAL